jgi:hypothetical protein
MSSFEPSDHEERASY